MCVDIVACHPSDIVTLPSTPAAHTFTKSNAPSHLSPLTDCPRVPRLLGLSQSACLSGLDALCMLVAMAIHYTVMWRLSRNKGALACMPSKAGGQDVQHQRLRQRRFLLGAMQAQGSRAVVTSEPPTALPLWKSKGPSNGSVLPAGYVWRGMNCTCPTELVSFPRCCCHADSSLSPAPKPAALSFCGSREGKLGAAG